MKFCYVDETGSDGRSPIFCQVGLIVDSVREGKTHGFLSKSLNTFAEQTGKKPQEIKGSDLYQGKNKFHKVDGELRIQIFESMCEFARTRKHKIALTVVNNNTAKEDLIADSIDCWTAGALNILLQVKKSLEGVKGNKGRTVFVFDEYKRNEKFLELVKASPDWISCKEKPPESSTIFDSVVDVPFFANSQHVELLQVVDVLAFMFRRYFELSDFQDEEKFDDEKKDLEKLVKTVSKRLLPKRIRYPSRKNCHCCQWFEVHSTEGAKNLGV